MNRFGDVTKGFLAFVNPGKAQRAKTSEELLPYVKSKKLISTATEVDWRSDTVTERIQRPKTMRICLV
jgi:hypothetical protein